MKMGQEEAGERCDAWLRSGGKKGIEGGTKARCVSLLYVPLEYYIDSPFYPTERLHPCHWTTNDHVNNYICNYRLCKSILILSKSLFSMVKIRRPRPQLQIALVVCLVLFMFICQHCNGNKKFEASSSSGLQNHQRKCIGHKKFEQEAAQQRKAVAALKKKKKATNLTGRKARIVSHCISYSQKL